MKSILSAVILSLFLAGVGIYTFVTRTTMNGGTLPQNGSSAALHTLYSSTGHEFPIPKATDWVDYGAILEAGGEGSWDFGWIGMASIVKKNGTYYFYYVASDGYRSHDGEAARHRAIGVATSQDGIHFTKYSGNPIMTHSPFSGEEEGANSAGITLSADGDFVMYYGAAIGPEDQINADGRVAVSRDGLEFTDLRRVLDHRYPVAYRLLPRRLRGAYRFLPKPFRGSALHGHGDEIFPVATFQHQGNWYVYYVPNGGTAPRTLGLAWGQSFKALPRSVKVLDGSWHQPVGAWGNVIWLAPDKIAVFVQRLWSPNTFVEVRTASPDAPQQLSEPVERYDIPNLAYGAVFLDVERRTWFMYYTTFDRFWKVKLAPAGQPDTTPPTMPTDLSVSTMSHDSMRLSWGMASDPETGVVRYHVYRDGVLVGNTMSLTFTDMGLAELTRYTYGVAAVNFHGVEGSPAQIEVTTPADSSPPTIVSVTSSVNPNQVTVVFNEAVDVTSAENTAHYANTQGVTIKRAVLGMDLKTVTLTTSKHHENIPYNLAVKNVLDRASTPNPIVSDSVATYTYSPIPGLVGYWNFDQGSGVGATDLSGYQNDGIIHGAFWQDGIVNQSLYFNGEDSYVLVPKSSWLANLTNTSFTFAAWAKPDDIPSPPNGYGILLRVADHPAYFVGISYLADRTYQAQLITMPEEEFIDLVSDQMEPKGWSHVAMVVDDFAKQLHLYVNGKPVSGSPKSYSGTLFEINQPTGENYIVGEYYIGSTKPDRGAGSFFSRHFKGLIDELRVYNRALNTAEIQRLIEHTESRLPRP